MPIPPLAIPQWSRRDLGELPITMINKVLGHDLEPGRLLLDHAGHCHIAERHPADLDICLEVLGVGRPPHFVGQAPRSDDKLQMVWRLNDPIVMVVFGRHWTQGFYRVVTSYRISRERLDRERRERTLVPILH